MLAIARLGIIERNGNEYSPNYEELKAEKVQVK
jgi:hypothetical protein